MSIKALCITQDPDRPTIATFAGLRQAGIDITVVCPADADVRASLSAAGVRILDLDIGGRFESAAAQRIRAELISGRYDILHLFSNRAVENGLRAARGLPIKVIAYRGIVGNVSFFSPVSWMRFLNPRIDRIVCVANAIRNYFLEMKPAFLRMPAERLVTIYKGHSLDWYTAEPAERHTLGIPEQAFVIACVANYRPRKGIEFLIDAIDKLPAENNVHLLLVGQMDSPRLEKKIAESSSAERVHRLGYRKDAPSITAAADVFILPSIKREGLARSLIEAMAYGVAPVVTDCGGSPEIVVDGTSGLVVPVRDADALAAAIRRLYQDPSLRAELGKGARARIRDNFRIEDTIEQTHSLYRSLVPEE